MRAIAGNYNIACNVTLPSFTSQTITPAPPRAETALFQHCSTFLNPSLKPSGTIKLLVSSYL
ncbi:hypothetical protein ACFLV4_03060 [Chloroflexota bacterium]